MPLAAGFALALAAAGATSRGRWVPIRGFLKVDANRVPMRPPTPPATVAPEAERGLCGPFGAAPLAAGRVLTLVDAPAAFLLQRSSRHNSDEVAGGRASSWSCAFTPEHMGTGAPYVALPGGATIAGSQGRPAF